jgi:peptide/nickel transport system ATP-binding protein
MMSNNLLEFRNVTKVFRIGGLIWGTRLVAVDDVNLTLGKDKPSILSIVGESGMSRLPGKCLSTVRTSLTPRRP